MKIDHLFENEDDHWEALRQTGYYGRQGAGCLFLALATGRLLLAKRSRYVEQSGTWGILGGAIDDREDPATAAQREAHEEAGAPPAKLIPLYVFQDANFRYSNFLALVKEEFHAVDKMTKGFRESDTFKWVAFGDWPQPLHFGVKAILNDPASIELITRYIKQI